MKLCSRLAGPGWPGHLAALAAGASLPLALAPFGYWPLALLVPAALLALLHRLSARSVLWRAWWFGLGLFGAGTSWVYVSIHDYGNAPMPLAAGLTILFSAGLAILPALSFWPWARWLRDKRGGIALGFPACWILGEWWRSWMLTGFPWLYIGYSQTDGPLAGLAPVAGVFGIGLLIAISASALYLLFTRRPRALWLASCCAALWAAAAAIGTHQWVEPRGRPLDVAMVQGNISQALKWEPGHLESTLALYRDLSAPLWGTDIVVWPEAAIPAYLDHVVDYIGENAARAARKESTLLLGLPVREASGNAQGYNVFNSVVAAGADSGLYHKRRLVPFGEYVPLEGWLRGLIDFFDLPMSNFSRGPEQQPLLAVQGIRIAPFICYEIVYPDLVAQALPDADALLTVSNDTWFGTSIGPLQHLEMARMRAMESGRPLIRATNNGVTALIDHRGHILVRGKQFTREVVRGAIQPMQGLTPFARFGSGPVLLLCGLLLLVVLLGRKPQEF
jgi:apolipoprotein N-acyltransferase